ncbi:dihydrolipoyl dehydrogenase [Microbacterium sp.]|uniref:dihydrolipoyl dehydrogenase n=1 Tax=Microbacterium sp. TaxID=51671 RepID=UPI003A84229E
MTEHSADLVLLGGGSGGYATALRAAELGRSVVVVEKDKLGGTCLHRGCVPTKALLHAAEVMDHVRDAAAVGVNAAVEGVDVTRLTAYREGIVAKKYAGLTALLTSRGITVVAGEGRLTADGDVRVGDDLYRGTDVVLATGSAPRTIGAAPVGRRILTSEEALTLDEVPARVVILGGGVIGVEFASLWRSFGAEVTVVEALDRLLPTEDDAVSKALARAFRKRGIASRLGARVVTTEQSDDAVTVTLDDGSALTADRLLVAVGRRPLTEGIGLDEAGVATESGFVTTDADGRTTVPHVWAVGDIVPGLQLAHRAFQQGIRVAEVIAGQAGPAVAESTTPRVTYSRPEAASVGLTEAQAREAHGDRVSVYEYNLAGNAKSEIIGTAGMVKVVRETDGPILGVHLVGDRVGELITEGQLAVGWEAHPEDIAPFVHAHPTQSEALGEAFLALAGKPLHAV